jgi:nucleoid DNA-binding protein
VIRFPVNQNPGIRWDVLITGFGKFCVNQKNERRGRTPATGDEIMLEPGKIVTFKWDYLI